MGKQVPIDGDKGSQIRSSSLRMRTKAFKVVSTSMLRMYDGACG